MRWDAVGWDAARVNVNGGAIALGHPVGASGCRILVSLLHEMERTDIRYGLATLCVGGGMGVSTIIEKNMKKGEGKMEKQFVETMFDIGGKTALCDRRYRQPRKSGGRGLWNSGRKGHANRTLGGKAENIMRRIDWERNRSAYAVGDPAVEEDVVRVVEETVRKFGGSISLLRRRE